MSLDQLDEAGIDPWHDVLSLEQFRAAFGEVVHPFTGVDYVAYYKSIIEEAGAQAEIVFANRVTAILPYTDTVITCDIHSRQRSKRLLTAAGAKVVLGLDDLLTAPVDGSGYNAQYGLLGSNKADDDRVKLFPRDAKAVAEAIGTKLDRGATFLNGEGSYSHEPTKVVLAAVKKQQVTELKELVMAIDPNAFVIVQEAHQVLGDGFSHYSKQTL